MISMLLEIFNPYEICFGKTITKIKKIQFPQPVVANHHCIFHRIAKAFCTEPV